MPDRPAPADYWVTIDVAATALDVSIPTAYRLANQHRWRRTPTTPHGYLMADIKTTATIRKEHRS